MAAAMRRVCVRGRARGEWHWRQRRDATAFNFDWDDNVLHMPTKVLLFRRGPDGVPSEAAGPPLAVSTGEYAARRGELGRAGAALAAFGVADDSFRHFHDPAPASPHAGRNFFLEDVNAAIDRATESAAAPPPPSLADDAEGASRDGGGHPPAAAGPSWHAFAYACATPRHAALTSIVTARHHAPASIHAGLVALQRRGLIAHVPPVANVFPVGYDPLRAAFAARRAELSHVPPDGHGDVAGFKLAVMAASLRAFASLPLDGGPAALGGGAVSVELLPARDVLSPDGDRTGRFHLWGYSDDDAGNYATARDGLGGWLRAHPLPTVKVVLFYTGRRGRTTVEVLRSDGSPRPAAPSEAVFHRRGRKTA